MIEEAFLLQENFLRFLVIPVLGIFFGHFPPKLFNE
jgi:hypothetical protein